MQLACQDVQRPHDLTHSGTSMHAHSFVRSFVPSPGVGLDPHEHLGGRPDEPLLVPLMLGLLGLVKKDDADDLLLLLLLLLLLM
jgi:hypothetical protein